MAIDLNDWLRKDLGLSEEDVAAIAPKLAGVATKIDEFGQRQSDYSRKMGEIQTKQGELDEANSRVVSELAELAELRAKGDPAASEAAKSLEEAQAVAARLRSRLTTLATQQGLDAKVVLEGLDAPVEPVKPAKPEPQAVDLSGYAKSDAVSRMGQYLMDLPVELADIADEHQTLFGERINRRQLVTDFKAQLSSKTPITTLTEFYEQKYPVAAKREEQAKTAHVAELSAAEARGYERRATEAALPNAHPEGASAPVFRRQNAEPVLKRPSARTQIDHTASAARSLEKKLVEFSRPPQAAGAGR